ncbi:TetR/AcrR family transcriptional regulator [Pseudomonas nitroreducens]|uniref:TetR/AcrR family transcriptional regulator n=1 Tax=Pseudomonas nitroreducens TaxID=46680 RepID=UPI0026598522|nr:TetR/AcrR family transcriptional regulator [Pseudomonas nitroreducens]MCP1647994.1 AcrR family transcriptional regulator [Pseudomonas nitroreducens]MCP1686570.1 AcrR family transcriptional regulator [Pseudomonas nitroreducens]
MPDPRVLRSRQKLANALFDLIGEGQAYPPAVNLVLERAHVARATFYSHFTDMDALLAWEVERILDEIQSSIDWQGQAQDAPFTGRVVQAVLGKAREQTALFRLLLTGGAGPIPLERFYSRFYETSLALHRQRCAAQNITPAIPLEVICSSISGQMIGVLRWMVIHQPDADIEQLVAWMRSIYQQGMSHLLMPAADSHGQ